MMLKCRNRQRQRFIFTLLLSGLLVYLIFLFIKNVYSMEYDREILLKQMELGIANGNNSASCEPPNLPVHSPEIMKFIKNVPSIVCDGAGSNWVKCVGSFCTIQEDAKNLYGNIECRFTEILRIDDYENSEGKSILSNDKFQLINSDVVKVECKSKTRKWGTILTTVRKNDTLWEESSWKKVPKDALKMNVLMFGVDSVSRNLFIRKLPKTYNYIKKNLKGLVLEGYNIVGDGTPQALIPMLTGKTELELPDTRKRFHDSKYVNSYPFIWNEFKRAGYVTGYLEDMPLYGIFTYRLKGFKDMPTDHYMRPYYLSALSEYKKWPKYCTGSTPSLKIMTDFIKDFFFAYKTKPKFMFGFHGELSHDDYNLIGTADDDFKDFLTELTENNMLNNTVLILFADHGHRFAAIRNTLQGKLEERLPFFSIILPEWFRRKYYNFYNALKTNEKRLTTPFDVHATLKSILNLSLNQDSQRSGRSLSLFSEIPSDRTCSKAFIEPHWCACLVWKPLETNSPIVNHLSNTILETLNNYTDLYRNLCDLWRLNRVNWVSKLMPNENLVKFKQNADKDGFLADLTAETRIERVLYQLNVLLKPDDALFEASITHYVKSNKFVLNDRDISRINMYGKQSRCIEDVHQDLRKYCHCKEQ